MLKKFIPFGVFLVILIFLFRGLALNPREMPSAQMGKHLPNMMLKRWGADSTTFSQWLGRPFILHFWATWCDSCQQDVLELEALKSLNIAKIIGVNYKDQTQALNNWLSVNPSIFDDLIIDKKGRLGLELGVVATPETFIIDQQGIVRYRYQGPLTQAVLEKQIVPMIQELSR